MVEAFGEAIRLQVAKSSFAENSVALLETLLDNFQTEDTTLIT